MMTEVGKVRQAWYQLQRRAGEQQHPIHTDDTLYPLNKLPITTEDKWTIERLRVESDIEAALEEMDAGIERVPAENNWRQIKHATYQHVAAFRAERDRLVAEGHVDDRHIDPSLATDEEVEAKVDELAARLAEFENLSEDDLREAVGVMRQEFEQFQKDGLDAYARKLLAGMPNAPDLPAALDESHDAIFERLDEMKAAIDDRCRTGLGKELEDIKRSISSLRQQETSGGAQRPFAWNADGAMGVVGLLSFVLAAVLGGWLVS